ncbi:Leucine-rich repeat protein kinase family protein [Euphorbia peplus]|nr:Leucine-rich repeat protein kinase family protein [Euphorbia peplus]
MEVKLIFFSILVLGFGLVTVISDPGEDDKQALLDFVNNLPHSRSLKWNESLSFCNWTGITCSKDGVPRVIALRLPGVGFTGSVPVNTISRLSALQTLSLRSNLISGGFPQDLLKLKKLSYLYLQFNNLSGLLPGDFSVWSNLTVVNLSNNRFSGSIPGSISGLTHLTALNLANNSLQGEIPSFDLPNLQQLSLCNNKLTGNVPKSLGRFPSSSFSGNNVSVSPVLAPSSSVPNPDRKARKGLSEIALLGIIVAACVIVFLAIFVAIMICCLRKTNPDEMFSDKLQKGQMTPEKMVSRTQDANNRLVFFEGCNYAFDLEDLLRASAEVLGKGTFGMAYKAILEDSTTVVVKRLKEVSVGKRDFEQQMDLVGSIRHQNVVELKAYYYSKDEKLIVCEYYSQGSVSSILHGKRGGERISLDWNARMKIATGAARGLACIHAENGGKFVHGNIKSSNIFLNSEQYGCISDLGLATIMSALAPPISRAAGYRAPEVTDTRKAGQPSDVYSFGVVLLELLTGKSPIHTTGGDEIIHLVRWVHSVVREEWTAEVFDVELMRCPNIEEEMVEMLQIALSCVVRMPDQRPKMTEIAKMIENVRRVEVEYRPPSGNRSESSTPPPPPPEMDDES